MDAEDIASGTVEPRDHDDLVPRPNPVEALDSVLIEHEPGVRRTLVALLGGGGEVGQWGLHCADRADLEPGLAQAPVTALAGSVGFVHAGISWGPVAPFIR